MTSRIHIARLHEPLRTRERAAVEVARKYLRAIIDRSFMDDTSHQLAAKALAEIAAALGERL